MENKDFVINKKKKLNFLGKQAREQMEIDYQNKILEIVEKTKHFPTDEQKLKYVFDWFNQNVKYDNDILKNRTATGKFTNFPYKYHTKISENDIECDIMCGEKFAPILLGKGICKGMSEAFKDICDLLGVECYVVSNRDENVNFHNEIAHSWNEVVLNGERKTIDTYYFYSAFLTKRRSMPTFKIKNDTSKTFEIKEKQ